jgi:hypothetical protein
MEVTFHGPAEAGMIMESGNAPQDWYIITAETGYMYVSLPWLARRVARTYER